MESDGADFDYFPAFAPPPGWGKINDSRIRSKSRADGIIGDDEFAETMETP